MRLHLKYMTSKTTLPRFIHIMCLVAILLTSFLLSVYGINEHPYRRDELTALGHMGILSNKTTTIEDTVQSLVKYSPTHPPLFYVLGNFWRTIVSSHFFTISLLPIFFAVLSLAFTYRLAKDINGFALAITSTILLMFSVLFLHYSNEMRQYSMLICGTSAVWLIYLRSIKFRHPLKLIPLIIIIIIVASYIYTHYIAVFILLSLGLYHLVAVPKTKNWWKISISFFIAGLLFIFWLPNISDAVDIINALKEVENPQILYNDDLLFLVPRFFGNGEPILFIILMALSFFAVFQKRIGSLYALYMIISLFVIISILNGQFEIIRRMRYMLPALVPFCIFAAFGLVNLSRLRFGITLASILMITWIGSGYVFRLDNQFESEIGITGIAESLEYQLLDSLIRSELTSDDFLFLVVQDFKSLKESKQKTNSTDKYYLDLVDVGRYRIHSSTELGTFKLDKALDKLDSRSDFWLTYRFEPNADHLKFLDAVEPDYQLCQSIPYGNQSYFEQYVKISEFDSLCNGQP